MRLATTKNNYGVGVAHFRCGACGVLYTITPAPTAEDDILYGNCTGPECSSYDPARDVDKWFDEGRVRAVPNGDGTYRLVPYRVIQGGKI